MSTPPLDPVLLQVLQDRVYDRMSAFHVPEDAEHTRLLRGITDALSLMLAPTHELLAHDPPGTGPGGSGRRRMNSPSRAPARALARLRDLAGVRALGQAIDALRNEISDRPRTRRCTEPALRADVSAALKPGTPPERIRILERVNGDALHTVVLVRADDVIDLPAAQRAARRHEVLFGLVDLRTDDSPLIGEWTRRLGDTTKKLGELTIGDVT